MPERVVTSEQAERFYDRMGIRLDRYSAFEERARLDMIDHGLFTSARSVFEFGCGTGKLAEHLLAGPLPIGARYLGIDVSSRMVEITRARIASFGARIEVRKSTGEIRIHEPDGSFDRFVATYSLDLLSAADASLVASEAHRVLAPRGLLCLVSLTDGETALTGLVSGLWKRIQSISPARVGGCRPIRLLEVIAGGAWEVKYRKIVTMSGVPAEVVIALRV